MSQVLLRAIEVKVGDQWRLLDIPTTRKEHYCYKTDQYEQSEKFNDDFYLNYVSEASTYLRDYVFGHYCNNPLKDGGIPDDISYECARIIPEQNVSCVNLKDWQTFIEAKENDWKKSLEEFYHKKMNTIINMKLDGILKGKSYDEVIKEIELAKENPEGEILDNEDIGYLEDEVWHEKYWLILALNNEYSWIYNILYDIYETWPECRIYYWID